MTTKHKFQNENKIQIAKCTYKNKYAKYYSNIDLFKMTFLLSKQNKICQNDNNCKMTVSKRNKIC